MASVKPSVRVVKSFTFKGGSRDFSNRYFFSGGTPADAAHWITLFDAITAAEKLAHGSHVTITEALGYAAGSDVAVASKVYSLAGTYTPPGGTVRAPGEAAALSRYATAARSTKNHPIYLFSYYHGVYTLAAAGTPDLLDTGQRTRLETYAGAWITGFSDGSITAKRTSPAGHDATGHITDEYVTHRDFPYTPSV